MISLQLAPFSPLTSVLSRSYGFSEVFDLKPTNWSWSLRLRSGERTHPRVLSLAPRRRLSLVGQEKHFGEAPKWAREGACAPRKRGATGRARRHKELQRP